EVERFRLAHHRTKGGVLEGDVLQHQVRARKIEGRPRRGAAVDAVAVGELLDAGVAARVAGWTGDGHGQRRGGPRPRVVHQLVVRAGGDVDRHVGRAGQGGDPA